MGSYGIGPARIAAAAVEQYADEKGISWPKAIAPWDVEVVALGKPGTPEREAAEARLRASCAPPASSVLLDDRDAGPGEKFADAELLGVPLRLTIGKRSLESGAAEAQIRRGQADLEGGVPLDRAPPKPSGRCGRRAPAERAASGRHRARAAQDASRPAADRSGASSAWTAPARRRRRRCRRRP